MRAIVQRVARSSVVVDQEVVGAIEKGVTILLGITHTDGETQARWLAIKIAGLRIFEDEAGKMNRSLLDVGGSKEKDLEMAKQAIDTLAMLRCKTEGNLTDEEQHLLDTILYDLRIKYLQQK